MIKRENFPILEFDDSKEALINPIVLQKKYGILPIDKLVITFFKEAINLLIQDNKIEEYLTIEGENDLVVYVSSLLTLNLEYVNKDVKTNTIFLLDSNN